VLLLVVELFAIAPTVTTVALFWLWTKAISDKSIK
jgi:hypothetical protein